MLSTYIRKLCDNRYEYIIKYCGLIHMLLVIIFLCTSLYQVAVLNIFSVIIYCLLGYFYGKTDKRNILSGFFAEVLCNACVSTILLGWECGFALYMVCIVPSIFYISYTDIKDHKMSYSYGVISMLAFILLRFYSYYTMPVLTGVSHVVAKVLYFYNTLICFFMLIVFSLIFSEQLKITQKELEENNEELRKLANTDALTNLMNRGCMLGMLSEAVMECRNNGQTMCLALCDIDDFKKINDTYGHDCGDAVLKHISDTIRYNVRKSDCVCRWGGEEFLVLMKNTVQAEAKGVIERVHNQIDISRIRYGDDRIHCTMTFGLIEMRDKSLTMKDLLLEVDRRLYEGKKSGKNCIVDE